LGLDGVEEGGAEVEGEEVDEMCDVAEGSSDGVFFNIA
jgi:hypothetical protein